jgi:hypothetical protein
MKAVILNHKDKWLIIVYYFVIYEPVGSLFLLQGSCHEMPEINASVDMDLTRGYPQEGMPFGCVVNIRLQY